jgi:hypothetical protein
MKLWPVLLVLLVAPTIAAAQPGPEGRRSGNLRVRVDCADDPDTATPERGLRLEIDGALEAASDAHRDGIGGVDENGDAFSVEGDSDIGYQVSPGRHHLALRTPTCAGEADIDVVGPEVVVSGRLRLTDGHLRGTATLPDWSTFVAGGYRSMRSAYTTSSFGTTYHYAAAETTGGELSFAIERRHFVVAVDQALGEASFGGTATQTNGHTGAVAPIGGSAFSWGTALRIGPRIAYRDVALAAGVGIGMQLGGGGAIAEGDQIAAHVMSQDVAVQFDVPVWASITYKPTCGFGIQATGTYELHPTTSDDTARTLAVGLVYQPSEACSEPARLYVRG